MFDFFCRRPARNIPALIFILTAAFACVSNAQQPEKGDSQENLHTTTGIAKEDKLKAYRYSDRDLWTSLPQTDYDFAGETLTLHKIEQPEADGSHLFLFIGETAVPNNGDALVMRHLAEKNPHSEVWFIDTPDALFIERERTGMRNNAGDFMLPIMQQVTQVFESVTLITMDVVSVPVLRGLNQWQSQTGQAHLSKLSQLILLYPSLYVNTPAAGRERELFPIVEHSALPISVFQPQLGAQANYIDESLMALRRGGSFVQLEKVAAATDGIYKFQDIRPMAKICSDMIDRSEKHMRRLRQKINYRVLPVAKFDTSRSPKSEIVSGLIKLDGTAQMPDIKLHDLQGNAIDVLAEHAGKALLINFWATWCPHCVEEIPSMNRALAQLDQDRFAMISISYKDTAEIMRQFTRKIQVDFPILMDYEGRVSAQWKVFAFPSSFLVDRHGVIRYSINAGAIWDSPDMLEKLREISQ